MKKSRRRLSTTRAVTDRTNEIMGPERLRDKLNAMLDDYPPFFFVVETGNPEMVKVWACHSKDLQCSYRGVPLLSFAIALAQSFRKDMAMVVKTLLSLGGSVETIPRAFYSSLHRDIPDTGFAEDELDDLSNENKAWYTTALAQRFAQALNFSFTIRYVLHLASGHRQLSGAYKKLAQVHKASELLGIRYFLVGQTLASGLPTEHFLAYLAMPTKHPLVLLFAGPSGHGKPELARNLGQLLSLDLHSVDCTDLSFLSDLFGPVFPYQGWEKGSATNNYLATHNAERCIIFMDEFEKTKDEVRQALLVPFQSGRITDFIPFLPFSPIEQAAVADKCLADLGQELAKPIDTYEQATRFRPVGNIDLQVKRGYSVCKALADQGYVQQLGARSIINTIESEIRIPLVGQYLAARDEISTDQPAGKKAKHHSEAGQTDFFLGLEDDERAWSDITARDPDRVQRRSSRRRRIWSAIMSIRSLLDTVLLLVILGLLWERGWQSSPRFEFGADITGFAPHISQQIKTFSPDPNFIPVNRSEFFTDEIRQRWLSIVPRGLGYVRINNTALYNNLPTPLESYPNYTFTTSVTHQLHCLHAIVETVAAYTSNELDKLPEEGSWHLNHCFDYLRQSIMCCGDVALEGQHTTFPPDVRGSDGWDAKHVCRDWGQVMAYLEGRRADDERWI
ncbi:hypothetical protein VTI74DRAFT_5880 [Chaetomium olivicolor]